MSSATAEASRTPATASLKGGVADRLETCAIEVESQAHLSKTERDYRSLMRKWLFAAAIASEPGEYESSQMGMLHAWLVVE